MKTIKVHLAFSYETKNKFRFDEGEQLDGSEPVIGSLYVSKKAFSNSAPKAVTVTLSTEK